MHLTHDLVGAAHYHRFGALRQWSLRGCFASPRRRGVSVTGTMTTDLSRRALLSACAAAVLSSTGEARAQNSPVATRTYRGRSEDEWLTLMATRPAQRMVSRHSSTAVVYCLDLGDGVLTAFKAERPRQETWWRHEIVSYRLAKLLGIDNRVPPVVGKRVPATVFGRYAASDRLVIQSDQQIRGSAAVWVPNLRGEQLHTPERRREWMGWMQPGAVIPAASRERARQISEVLLFDWLMANSDRWNCCNIPVDEGSQLVVRDNDGGWFLPIISRVNEPDMVRRLSRRVWERLRATDGAALRAEVERDPLRSENLLGRAEYAAYDRRHERVVAHVEGLIRRWGEPAVLAWP